MSSKEETKKKSQIWVGEVEENGKIMKEVKSCGLIIFRTNPQTEKEEFLLMKQPKYYFFYWIFTISRYDLCKGHREEGETDIETAFREMNEETGLLKSV